MTKCYCPLESCEHCDGDHCDDCSFCQGRKELFMAHCRHVPHEGDDFGHFDEDNAEYGRNPEMADDATARRRGRR